MRIGVGSRFFWNPTFDPSFDPTFNPMWSWMVPVMALSPKPIAGLLNQLDIDGRWRAGRASAARWVTAEPELGPWATPGDMAEACRSATSSDRDRLLSALVRVAGGDQLAQLTVVAGMADRLSRVVGGWARAGVPRSELSVMEADLVAECWIVVARLAEHVAAGSALPDRLGAWLIDEAREPVRVPRRRELRAAARRAPMSDCNRLASPGDPRTAADRLAVELADAVRARRVSRSAIQPVFLTRVAGYPVADAARRLGCTPQVLRALRSRAERQLAA